MFSLVIYSFLSQFSAAGLQSMCRALSNKNETSETPELDAFAGWFRGIFTTEFCLDVNIGYRANEASEVSWSFIDFLHWRPNGLNIGYPYPSRPQLWLACTQLGGFPTNVNSESLFQHAVGQDTFFRFCQAAFEEYDFVHLEGSVAALNRRFGGSNPSISNIIYTNAELDPWASFGVTGEQTTANTHVFHFGKCSYK